MQNTVTLKIGDILEADNYRGGSNHTITSFGKDKINTANRSFWAYPLRQKHYYVNGKLYAREDIIVPEFLEVDMSKAEIACGASYVGVVKSKIKTTRHGALKQESPSLQGG